MSFRTARRSFVLGCFLVIAIACGARSSLEIYEGPPTAGDSVGGGPPDCVVFNSSSQLDALDVFIMLDSSGSMDTAVDNGPTKWIAVRQAFDAFVSDAESNGIGMAISFFPIIDFSVPELCLDDAGCGAPDTCTSISACSSSLAGCASDSDCAAQGFPDETCEPLGICENEKGVYCVVGSLDCPGGTGPCVDLGFCENHYTCDAQEYGSPVFGPEELPDAGVDFMQAISAKLPEGATPTLPALTGAVSHAVEHAASLPDHKVIVVLATDGFPTACDPDLQGPDPQQAIDNIANVAAAGAAQGIQTYVIGVFSPDEQVLAQSNLDAIAAAGDTEAAWVVSTASGVSGEFLAALNQVRLSAKACEFDLKQDGEPIDYATVWVRISPNGEEPVWVARVESLAQCDPELGGFYFDQPIDGPVPPSKVILCPATCTLLGASPNRTVEVFTTCPDPVGD